MRLAILGDIHGNPLALDAVLDDVEAWGGADGYLLMGDFSAIGPDPVGPLDRIDELSNAVCVRGNTDRAIVSFDFDERDLADVAGDPATVAQVLRMARSFAWTQGYLSAFGWMDWLRDLPLDYRFTLPDGTRVLAVHASPGMDDGPGVTPATSTEQLVGLLEGADAELIIVGHTHWPQDHRLGGVRVINPGSVSNPPVGDTRASYARLEASESGYKVEFRRVEYDFNAALDAIRQSDHPARDYMLSFLEGRVQLSWQQALGGAPIASPFVRDHSTTEQSGA